MSKTIVINGVNYSNNAVTHVTLDGIHTQSISVSPTTISENAVGGTHTLTATVYPSDSEDQIIWGTSNANVATVIDGVVTISGCGTCDITALSGSFSATCSISVEVPLGGTRYIKTRVTSASSTSASRLTTATSTILSTYGSLDMDMCILDTDSTMSRLNCARNIAVLNETTQEYEIDPEASIIKNVGYVIPVILPANCTKIRCRPLNANYASYPLFFKSNVRADEAVTQQGYYSALRYSPYPTYSTYDFVYEEETEYDIPAGYDSVTVMFVANTADSSVPLFTQLTQEQVNQFTVTCL